jgi:hypothetical protein
MKHQSAIMTLRLSSSHHSGKYLPYLDQKRMLNMQENQRTIEI